MKPGEKLQPKKCPCRAEYTLKWLGKQEYYCEHHTRAIVNTGALMSYTFGVYAIDRDDKPCEWQTYRGKL